MNFGSIEEAFRDFVDTVYQHLLPEQKHKLKNAVFRFRNTGDLSFEKMREILNHHGYKVETPVAKKNMVVV